MAAPTVSELTPARAGAWDAYVAAHPCGTFCHRAGWQHAVEKGAGHRAPYLIAEDASGIRGVMPLTLRKSALFGKALISNMFCVYGGSLVSDLEAQAALDEAAWKIARENGIDVLECRTVAPVHEGAPGWRAGGAKAATFIRDIPPGTGDEVLLSIPRKQRAVVRKTLERNLHCDWSPSLRLVYDLYARSVHGLGTPVFPFKLFEALTEAFPDNHILQVIHAPDGKPVASLVSFHDGRTVLPYYAGGTVDARAYGAHDYMYYQLMLWARDRGIKAFDFGRSKVGTGPYSFKKNWGFEPTPLEYEFRLAEGAALPDLSPQNAKFALMVQVWKKLPLGVANLIGPMLARHLG